MNKDIIEGNWKKFKGKLKEQWGKLTNDQPAVAGKRDQLTGAAQGGYGTTKNKAKKQVEDVDQDDKK